MYICIYIYVCVCVCVRADVGVCVRGRARVCVVFAQIIDVTHWTLQHMETYCKTSCSKLEKYIFDQLRQKVLIFSPPLQKSG